jgi:hypothetical protein
LELLREELPAPALRAITLRAGHESEQEGFRAALEAHHYLGAPSRRQCVLGPVALLGERPVALLTWTHAGCARWPRAKPGWAGTRARASGEKTLARDLVAALPPGTLDGRVVIGDALYADQALVRELVSSFMALFTLTNKPQSQSLSVFSQPAVNGHVSATSGNSDCWLPFLSKLHRHV